MYARCDSVYIRDRGVCFYVTSGTLLFSSCWISCVMVLSLLLEHWWISYFDQFMVDKIGPVFLLELLQNSPPQILQIQVSPWNLEFWPTALFPKRGWCFRSSPDIILLWWLNYGHDYCMCPSNNQCTKICCWHHVLEDHIQIALEQCLILNFKIVLVKLWNSKDVKYRAEQTRGTRKDQYLGNPLQKKWS